MHSPDGVMLTFHWNVILKMETYSKILFITRQSLSCLVFSQCTRFMFAKTIPSQATNWQIWISKYLSVSHILTKILVSGGSCNVLISLPNRLIFIHYFVLFNLSMTIYTRRSSVCVSVMKYLHIQISTECLQFYDFTSLCPSISSKLASLPAGCRS